MANDDGGRTDDEMLTLKEAASRLDCSSALLVKLIQTGGGPAYCCSIDHKKVKFRVRDIRDAE